MILNTLTIEGFRNLASFQINMNPHTNIVFGNNGHGKTSVLEAIYFLSIGKSFKTSPDILVKNSKKPYFEIKGKYISQNNLHQERRIYFSEKEGKHLFAGKNEIKKISEFIGSVPVVLLTLDDMNIMFNGPEYRRKFMDILLSQANNEYLNILQRYNKLLTQRNALLTEIRERRESISALSVWNDQLIKYNFEIVVKRMGFVEFLSDKIEKTYTKIAGKKDSVRISYKSGSTNHQANDVTQISDLFKAHLEKNQDIDIQRQITTVGCHRDDLIFTKDNHLFKQYASQGENKSFLISLKKIEAEYIENKKNERPIILFDDIFSELDERRISGSANLLKESGQVIITTTSSSIINKYPDTSFFEIADGEIINASY